MSKRICTENSEGCSRIAVLFFILLMINPDTNLPRIICVIGPTGSGKNDLALGLSNSIPLEIINFDSRQVYADLPIITAQPPESERALCPHHLYGFLGLRHKISAGRFTEKAVRIVAEVSSRDRMPVLVGGTGLYLRSLIYGLAWIPDVPEEIYSRLEKECRESGVDELYRRLSAADPDYSRSITSRDRHKIVRALGVCLATGKPFSQWHREQNRDPVYNVLKFGIWTDLQELKPWLEKRISRMIRDGAAEEIQKAWEKSGHDLSCPAFSGIGCRELIKYIQGKTDLNQARAEWLQNTRSYAKRQLTWFRKEPDVHWVKLDNIQETVRLANIFLHKGGS